MTELVSPSSRRLLGQVGVEVLADLLARRSGKAERPEGAILDLGLVDERDFALALAIRSGLPFVGLRSFAPDPAHFLYIPLALALTEHVCPLALGDDSLRVATAFIDPDMGFVQERFPSLKIEFAVSPRAEILAALRGVIPRSP